MALEKNGVLQLAQCKKPGGKGSGYSHCDSSLLGSLKTYCYRSPMRLLPPDLLSKVGKNICGFIFMHDKLPDGQEENEAE